MPLHTLPILQRPSRPPLANRLQDEHPLYRPAEIVTHFDAKLHELVAQMDATMVAAQGIGIAAPQVGACLAVFIIDFPDPLHHPRYQRLQKYREQLQPVAKQLFINPYITRASTEGISFWHACLSAQGLSRGKVATYPWIEYAAQDLEGQTFTGRLENMAAIIFQHEFRHLLGLMYCDQAREFLETETLFAAIDRGELDVFSTSLPEDPFMLGDYQIGETLTQYRARLA